MGVCVCIYMWRRGWGVRGVSEALSPRFTHHHHHPAPSGLFFPYIIGRLGRLAVSKYTLEITFFFFLKKSENDSRESATRRIRSPFSFITKLVIGREAGLRGTPPGSSSPPNPQRSFPSFLLGSVTLFSIFGL